MVTRRKSWRARRLMPMPFDPFAACSLLRMWQPCLRALCFGQDFPAGAEWQHNAEYANRRITNVTCFGPGEAFRFATLPLGHGDPAVAGPFHRALCGAARLERLGGHHWSSFRLPVHNPKAKVRRVGTVHTPVHSIQPPIR